MNEQNEGLDDAIIEELHLTKFTKREQLRQQLSARGYYLPDRQLRKHIEDLVTKEHYAIGSCLKGYYLIITKEDLEQALHELRSKAEALSIRANCLIRNQSEGKLQQQLTLFA